jgi:hypothetical protein
MLMKPDRNTFYWVDADRISHVAGGVSMITHMEPFRDRLNGAVKTRIFIASAW